MVWNIDVKLAAETDEAEVIELVVASSSAASLLVRTSIGVAAIANPLASIKLIVALGKLSLTSVRNPRNVTANRGSSW